MANATALLELQAAIFELLTSTAALTNLAPVFDEVPEGQAYPYVELGHMEEQIDNTFTKAGRSVLVQLDVYSDQPGNKEVEQIVEQLNLLLDVGGPPDTASWHTFQSYYELGTLQKEFDQVPLRHFVAQYRINCQQIP